MSCREYDHTGWFYDPPSTYVSTYVPPLPDEDITKTALTDEEITKTALTDEEITLKNKLLFDMTRRAGLRRSANWFRSTRAYSKGAIERTTCIWADGKTSSWHGKSSGVMWVGVYGTDSICVVSRDYKIQDKKNPNIHSPGKGYFTGVRRVAISDILDLGDTTTYCALRQKRCKGIEKPFGVVSVIPLTNVDRKRKRHEVLDNGYAEDLGLYHTGLFTLKIPPTDDEKETTAIYDIQWDMGLRIIDKFLQTTSKAEHDEKNAINFLQRIMRSKKDFTLDETIQTAISAFQKLFKKKFESKEIQVSVIDPNYGVTAEEIRYKDEYVKELETSEIEEHLAVINEPPGTSNKVSKKKDVGDPDVLLKA